MKLRAMLAVALALAGAPALAQVQPGTSPLSIAKGGTAANNASTARTNLGLAIGVNVQAFDAELAAIAGLTAAADKCFYFTGVGAAATYDCTSFSRGVMAQTSAANWRSTLGLAIGSNVQAWDTDLDCIAALSSTGQIKRTGAGTCSAGSVALADLATGTQDTIIGYFGSTTASATAINNCTGALTYSTGTHTFGCNATAGTGTVTSVTLGAGYGIAVTGTNPVTTSGTFTAAVSLTSFAASAGSNIATNSATYTIGAQVAQGSTGTWFAIASVAFVDSAGAQTLKCRITDGTVGYGSSAVTSGAAVVGQMSFSGIVPTPAANIRVECQNTAGATTTMLFNQSGNGFDTSIRVFRIS